jgi:hypothetical protein
MAIINEIPLATKQQLAKNKMNAQINGTLGQFQSSIASLMAFFWLNPELTPQQMSDAFGTDAATLFVLMSKVSTFMNDVKPNSLNISPTKAFVINQDGTVTISS